jgi:hypothetical protein
MFHRDAGPTDLLTPGLRAFRLTGSGQSTSLPRSQICIRKWFDTRFDSLSPRHKSPGHCLKDGSRQRLSPPVSNGYATVLDSSRIWRSNNADTLEDCRKCEGPGSSHGFHPFTAPDVMPAMMRFAVAIFGAKREIDPPGRSDGYDFYSSLFSFRFPQCVSSWHPSAKRLAPYQGHSNTSYSQIRRLTWHCSL